MKLAAAIIALCFSIQPAVAQNSIIYCIEIGRLARDIAHSIEDGLAPENINFAFPNARPDEIDEANAWAENLKLDVVKTMSGDVGADLAAQKIMEDCAFKYGAQFKRTGSADSQSRQQFCWAQISTYKRLYSAIKAEGTEAIIAKHPPGDEGIAMDRALALGAEIEDDADAQAWLQSKWDECMSEQKI